MPINEVVEIIRIQPITEVVNERDYIAGIISLRGSIIPVVHLRKRYRLPILPFNKKSRIIIIQIEEEKIGLIVDEMLMVSHIEDEQLEPPLEMFNAILKQLVQVKRVKDLLCS